MSHVTICHMTVKEGVNCSYRSQGEKGRKPFSEVVLLGIFGWHSEWEERATII